MKKKDSCYVMRVYEICDHTIKSLPYDELATRAKSLIKSRGLKKVAVTDEKNSQLLGNVRRERLITLPSTLSNTILLKDLMEEPVLYTFLAQEVKEITYEMLKRNEDCIPVVEEKNNMQYEGILTMEAILDAVTKLGNDNINKSVKEVMKRDIPYVKSNDNLVYVWKKMIESKCTGLIVVNNENKVVGVITEHDLLSSKVTWLPQVLNEEDRNHLIFVSDLMNKHVHYIKENVTVLEASKQMLKYRIGRLPVVNEEEKLLGVVDRKTLVNLLVDSL